MPSTLWSAPVPNLGVNSLTVSSFTTATEIEVVGAHSGGEVEFVLLHHSGRMWVGAGSDHTDREVETYGVTVSKQMCDKPVAPVFWAFDDVAPHWDRLMLRSHVIGAVCEARSRAL